LIQGRNTGEDAAGFGSREHDGQFELGIGANQFQFGRPDAVERFFPEQFNGANGLRAGLTGDLFVGLEMEAILADFFGRDQVGRLGVELAELAEAGVIGLLGARTDGQEL